MKKIELNRSEALFELAIFIELAFAAYRRSQIENRVKHDTLSKLKTKIRFFWWRFVWSQICGNV